MTTDWLENAQRNLEKIALHRTDAIEAQQQVESMSATVTSSSGLLTVSVGAQGDLRDLKFNLRDYRDMPSAELAHVIVETIGLARESVMRQILDTVPALSFGGMSLTDIMQGKADWTSLFPEALMPEATPFPSNGSRAVNPGFSSPSSEVTE